MPPICVAESISPANVNITAFRLKSFLSFKAELSRSLALARAAALEAERSTVAGDFRVGRDLAEEVRRFQRERPDARAQLEIYCCETLGGIKDPMKHTVASLRRFLLMVPAS